MQLSTKIPFNVTSEEYIKAYLLIFKGLAELTGKEISVLEQFIIKQAKLEAKGLSGEELSELLFSVKSRKEIQEILGFSYNQLHNYFVELVKRNLIAERGGYYYIDDYLLPKRSITFEFNIVYGNS
jgi:predicted Rossmann fold nucleotide-binding protein DprA/Smf involved in DNA uptake